MQAKKRFWGIFAGGQDRFMAAVLASADRIKQKRIHRWRRASRLRDQAIWLDDLPVGLLVGAGTNQKLHYVQPDALGTPRVVIDPQRDVAVWNWDLAGEAFGNTPPNQDPDGDGAQFVFDMRFAGQRYDVASGLSQNYFREYESSTGRYSQSDPIGLAGAISTYSYAHARPLTLVDPQGLETWQGCPDGSVAPTGACGYWPPSSSTYPNWGPPRCSYYDEQCNSCPRDEYACTARKCCESFGNNPPSNCTRKCLIEQDSDCRGLPGEARNKCRFRNHVRCYTVCGNVSDLASQPWNRPACRDAMAGMGGPTGGYWP